MKRFLKKTWMGIPIGVIITVLVGTAVIAVTFLGTTQTIAQNISKPPPDYGSITTANLGLTGVEIGGSFTDSSGVVVVELTDVGVGKYLHLALDDTTTILYTNYSVTLISLAADNDMSTDITLTVTKGGPLNDFIQLTEVGIYTFSELITGTAGGSAGATSVKITVTLEDS